MKLSSDAADNRILYEGITNYTSLFDFDTKSIQRLPVICIKTIPAIAADNANNIAAEPEVSLQCKNCLFYTRHYANILWQGVRSLVPL